MAEGGAEALQLRGGARYMDVMDQIAVRPFSVSPRAATRINEIVAGAGSGPDKLRVAVLAGGCSGFQYKFELDGESAPDDVLIERDGARVLVDPASLDLLAGAELDFVDKLMGAHFTVRNPNATSACGCGTSFSIE